METEVDRIGGLVSYVEQLTNENSDARVEEAYQLCCVLLQLDFSSGDAAFSPLEQCRLMLSLCSLTYYLVDKKYGEMSKPFSEKVEKFVDQLDEATKRFSEVKSIGEWLNMIETNRTLIRADVDQKTFPVVKRNDANLAESFLKTLESLRSFHSHANSSQAKIKDNALKKITTIEAEFVLATCKGYIVHFLREQGNEAAMRDEEIGRMIEESFEAIRDISRLCRNCGIGKIPSIVSLYFEVSEVIRQCASLQKVRISFKSFTLSLFNFVFVLIWLLTCSIFLPLLWICSVL
jgi:flagellar biosynthesis chaperone FliJ